MSGSTSSPGIRGLTAEALPFLVTLSIGVAAATVSMILGSVPPDLLGYDFFWPLSAMAVLMGGMWGWRTRSERVGRTMDLGSGWRAPWLTATLSLAALVATEPAERAEYVAYAAAFSFLLGGAGAVVIATMRRCSRVQE